MINLLSLPFEVLLLVLEYLCLEDIIKLRRVCKTFYNKVLNSYLLRNIILKDKQTLLDSHIIKLILKSTSVKTLDIFRCQNICGDFTQVLNLKKFHKLTVLIISYTNFTDENLRYLLKETPSLLTLWINDCQFISDNSIDAICKLKFLNELKIGTQHISPMGVLKIVSNCKVIKTLDTDGIVLNGTEFKQLAELGKHLECLDVSGSIICDDDLLSCYQNLKGLKTLIMIDCLVTNQTRNILLAEIPGLKLYILPGY